MTNDGCSHASQQKVFFFKWWLCPACRELIRELMAKQATVSQPLN
jgi:hypothetical protein